MLANIVGQFCMLSRFAMLANIMGNNLKICFFECFYYEIIISNVFRTREILVTVEFISMLAKMLACYFYGVANRTNMFARNVGQNGLLRSSFDNFCSS